MPQAARRRARMRLWARDQVGHLRRPRHVKSLDLLLDRPVGLGDPLVLAQMLEPGFHEERLHHASFLGGILENAPRIGTVTAAFLAELFECREKRLAVARIDAVFD